MNTIPPSSGRGWRIQKIRQRQRNDCGVACLAMLTGATYGNAFDSFTKVGLHIARGRRAPLSANFKNMIEAGHQLGFELVMKRFGSWEEIADCAIIKVMRQQSGNWHWVVAVRREVGIEILDPDTDLPSFQIEPFDIEFLDFSIYKPAGNILQLALKR